MNDIVDERYAAAIIYKNLADYFIKEKDVSGLELLYKLIKNSYEFTANPWFSIYEYIGDAIYSGGGDDEGLEYSITTDDKERYDKLNAEMTKKLNKNIV